MKNTSVVKRSGFTLSELLVVVAILAILAAMLFPVYTKSRENARRTSCQSNLKQIGLGLIQYAQDYDEYFPRANTFSSVAGVKLSWRQLLQPYIKSTQIFVCPSNPNGGAQAQVALDGYPAVNASYAANCSTGDSIPPSSSGLGAISCNYTIPVSLLASTAQCIVVVESTARSSFFDIRYAGNYGVETDNTTGTGYLFSGHGNASNFLFADGHVKAMKPLATINECPPSICTPHQANLWARDQSPFIGSLAQNRQTLLFAVNKAN